MARRGIRRGRGLRVPDLGGRALLCVCGVLLATCVAVGLATRASLTDYGSNMGVLDGMPFVVRPARGERLELLSDEEVAQEAASTFGEDAGSYSPAEAAEILGLSRVDLAEGAELVVTGTFTGERSYGYETLVSEVEVGSVLSGEGVAIGDVISVYEGLAVVEPENFTGLGQFSDEREVTPLGMTPNYYGAGVMREGEGYLLFLNRKRSGDAGDDEARYCQANSPYGHLALDAPNHSERVRVCTAASSGDAEDERIPFGEAREYDMFVIDEEARELYLENCARLLESTLG